jgi:hypothetical protein
MPKVIIRCLVLALATVAAHAGPSASLRAQGTSAPAVNPPEETEEEKKERAIRKVCAVAICSTLHNQKPATGTVDCNVQKTWRKEVLTRILAKGGLSWPWGKARCVGDLKLDRATLVKAMTQPEFEAQFDKHDVRCDLELEKDKYEVKLQIQPKVTFKQGKAVKASLNWGKIEAPTLAKSALWSATAADNSFGVLQSTVVDDINDFIHTKCMEVKGEWQGK